MKNIKKKRSKILVPIIICAVVIISILLFLSARYLTAMASMRPLPSQEVTTDVFSINNSFVNLYLLKSGEKYIAFDAGSDVKATEQALNGFGIDESDISALFLTHTDYDHVAAVPLFSSADVYMAQSNKAFIEKASGRSRSKAFVDMGRDYKTMADGEAVTVAGTEIQCIFTPGHTDGSASYVVNGRYLFTGDTLRLKNGEVTLFFAVFNMNDEEQKQSISKLTALSGIEAVFTMHTGYTTDFSGAFSKIK